MSSRFERDWYETAERLQVPDFVYQKLSNVLGALSAHDLLTAEHSMRVGVSAVAIGEYRGLPLKPLFYGGTLHDRGKLNVAGERLRKTTEWTDEDRQALSQHPTDGYEATLADRMIVTAGLIVRHHTFQTNSYPEVVPDPPPFMQESFMDCARTVAIADVYDAAHRTNSAGFLSGDEIRDKMQDHNPDLTGLIDGLYETGVFSTAHRAF